MKAIIVVALIIAVIATSVACASQEEKSFKRLFSKDNVKRAFHLYKLINLVKKQALAEAEEESDSESGVKLSHADALAQIKAVGIAISSSGGCSDRFNSRCTSLDQVNSGTITGIVTLKRASGCSITITGGTETGHAQGTKSHSTGYKLDISLNSCIDSYVTRSFSYIGQRSDGAAQYQSSAGNIYAKEGNHWDILYQ